ncbi:MAG TPA: thiaminase II [Nitriliruptorales bacterium]|nr:thiaminase II [Nitriliruptorales bacterium]
MSQPLTRTLWSDIAAVYDAILAHPFLRGLTDGSLDPDAFAFYVVQDAHYLTAYARALAVCAARAPADTDVAMFSRHAAGAIEVERQLHDQLLGELGIDPASVPTTPVAPTNLAYTSYLLATCYGGSFPEALGAVLPCYWIYWEVGKTLWQHGSPDPRYQRWIDTYGGEEFGGIVQEVLDVTDRVGARLAPGEVQRVRRHFTTTSRYEWMFWDMGLRREAWPV